MNHIYHICAIAVGLTAIGGCQATNEPSVRFFPYHPKSDQASRIDLGPHSDGELSYTVFIMDAAEYMVFHMGADEEGLDLSGYNTMEIICARRGEGPFLILSEELIKSSTGERVNEWTSWRRKNGD